MATSTTAAVRQGQGPLHKRPLQYVSTLETPKTEGRTAKLRKDAKLDPIFRESLNRERLSGTDCEDWDTKATSQTKTDPKFQRTEAEREGSSLTWLEDRKRRQIGTRHDPVCRESLSRE